MAEFINEGNPIKTNISYAFVDNPEYVPHALVLCSRQRVRRLNRMYYTEKKDRLADSGITPINEKAKDPKLDTENAGRLFEKVCGEDERLSVDTKHHSVGFGSNQL